MLTNISTQATLLLGFALATFGADLLPYILDDQAVFCIYKSTAHQLVGALFLTTNTCCVSFCLLVVIFSSFLIHRSQEAFLHIGGSVAVYRTQILIHRIYVWYALALMCFIFAAVLLLWVFLGLPAYVDHTGIYEESDFLTLDGRVLTACLSEPACPCPRARAAATAPLPPPPCPRPHVALAILRAELADPLAALPP
jgi:hypothetical protein